MSPAQNCGQNEASPVSPMELLSLKGRQSSFPQKRPCVVGVPSLMEQCQGCLPGVPKSSWREETTKVPQCAGTDTALVAGDPLPKQKHIAPAFQEGLEACWGWQ